MKTDIIAVFPAQQKTNISKQSYIERVIISLLNKIVLNRDIPINFVSFKIQRNTSQKLFQMSRPVANRNNNCQFLLPGDGKVQSIFNVIQKNLFRFDIMNSIRATNHSMNITDFECNFEP